MANWLITGVSGGLGRALAVAALQRGDKVVGTLRKEADRQAFEALAPDRAIGLLLDLSHPEDAAAAVKAAETITGGIDRLVNNAGYGLTGAVEETSLAEARALFDVNFFGAVAMIQAVLPVMRTRRAGHIVNITSMSGWAPWAGTAFYGATKYALECIGQTLAQEVAELGIRVTNVAPGAFRTSFTGASLVEAAHRIPDYDGTARQSKHILADIKGQETGDPALAATAILAALDAPEPPIHLFLGEDSVRHIVEHLDHVRGQMDRWESLTFSTAFAA